MAQEMTDFITWLARDSTFTRFLNTIALICGAAHQNTNMIWGKCVRKTQYLLINF